MEWYLKVLKSYATISGRARRTEYWMFVFFNAIICMVLGLLMALEFIPEALFLIYYIGIIIPSISVGVRRLHDTGRSGWWMFTPLIPFIGTIVFIILMCVDSQENMNKYGRNPKLEL